MNLQLSYFTIQPETALPHDAVSTFKSMKNFTRNRECLISIKSQRVPGSPWHYSDNKTEHLKRTILSNHFKNKTIKKMKLFTKAIEAKAQEQFPFGNDLEKQVVVAKFFNPTGTGTWYLINQDPSDPDYCWGICHIFEWEVGSFSKSELENYRCRFGLGIERDLHFEEVNAKELLKRLVK